MNLLLIHPHGRTASVIGVAELCAKIDFPFLKWSPGREAGEWEEELYRLLAESTHCCIVSPESDSEAWFLFAAAYCLGKGNPLFLFVSEDSPDAPVPGYLAGSAIRGGRNALGEFLAVERRSWKRRVIRMKVNEMLEKRGIPFTAEGFAQAVSDGDRRDVRLFLKADSPVTIRNRDGVPLLNIAVRNGHRAIVPLLLSRGADIDAVSQDRNNTALMDAAAKGDPDILSDLLEAGAGTDFQSKNGQTALVLAIGGGFIRCAELLIGAGADATIKDKLGMDAVTYARLFKHETLLELISNLHGANPSRPNP